jgi:hypothetical protein
MLINDMPRPTWGLSYTELYLALGFAAVFALAAIAYLGMAAVRERSPLPLFMLVGAGLCVFYEPFNNVLGLFTYPEQPHQAPWVTILGRAMPLYIGLVFVFYFSLPVYLLVRAMERGMTSRQWWTVYLGTAAGAALFEWTPLHRRWFTYYGSAQPLQFGGFPPAWWWFVDALSVFGVAVMIVLLRRHGVLTDRTAVLVVPLIPVTLFAVHGSAAMPAFAAMSSTTNIAVTTVCSLGSIGLALLSIHIYQAVVGTTGTSGPMRGNEPAHSTPNALVQGQ